MARRHWLAPLGSILFGALLLCAVEGLLRFTWTPPSQPAEQLTAVEIDPFEVNNAVARIKAAYRGVMRESSFVVPKPDGTFRIFCVGGSTTFGYPYPASVAWAASLERRLDLLAPERKFEVVNVGATSYGSARTLAVLRGLLKYQPDLVIVATGDAEFVEDSFRVAVASPAPAVTWLHGLYLSRVLKAVLPEQKSPVKMVAAEDRSAAGFLFSPVVTGTVYRVDSARRNFVMTALMHNLREMTVATAQAGVPLLLVTLPANIVSWPPDPDHSQPKDPGLRDRWRQLVANAERLFAAGNSHAALADYAAAVKLWAGNATVCFDYGQLLLAAGRLDEAQVMLRLAVDLDPTPVRATSVVNQAIRSTVDQTEALLADPMVAFEGLSANGLPGEQLILDYAHPTPRGHVEIARTVLNALTSLGTYWEFSEEKKRSVHQSELQQLASDKPMVNANLSFTLGQVFERKGLTEQAAIMYRQAIEQGYRGPFPGFNLARLLALQGHFAEALALVSPLVEQYPDWNEPYGLLGYLHQQRGETRVAAVWYQRALDAGEQDPRLFGTLAELQLNDSQILQARKTLEEGLLRNPGHCELMGQLGRVLERQEGDQGVEAESYYRKQLTTDPSCQLLWENLGLLLLQQKRWSDAEESFLAALSQPAPLAQHHLNLGYIYLDGLQDKTAAARHFARFLQLKPEQVELLPREFQTADGPGGQQ